MTLFRPHFKLSVLAAAGMLSLLLGALTLARSEVSQEAAPADADPVIEQPAEEPVDGRAAKEAPSGQPPENAVEPAPPASRTKLPAPPPPSGAESSFKGKVVVIPIKGKRGIGKNEFNFIRRIIKRADSEGAEAIILDVNTPGGELGGTLELMLESLQRITTKTITFVNPKALSAGSLIAIATDVIYMANPGSIGAAAVVTGVGGDLPETMKSKIDSALLATARSVAEYKGHRKDVAEAFIDKEKEVNIGWRTISKKGELLTLASQEAVEVMEDGKPLLAKGFAKSLQEVVEKEGLKGEIVITEPSGFESVASWILALSPVLILMIIAGVYMELNTPGFGVAGIVALAAFALLVLGHNIAGLTGYEVIVVFALGVVLLAVEFFLFPGTILFGALGSILIIGSLIYIMVDRYPGDPVIPTDFEMIEIPLLNMALAILGFAVVVAVFGKYFARMPAFNWLMLKRSVAAGASLDLAGNGAAEGEKPESLVGLEGVASTPLHPSGKGIFGDRLLDVVADGEFIDADQPIRIVTQEGARLVVRRV